MKSMKKIFFSLCITSSLMWGYSNTVFKVQQQLNELGYSVSIDGEMGHSTTKAIRQYQEDNGLRVTGRITNEFLGSLGINRNITSQSQISPTTHRNASSSNNGSFFDELGEGSLSNSLKNGKYQIGFLAAWPAYGISLKMDYSNKMTFEIVAAPMGTISLYSAKINYYLSKKRKYNTYAYASGGAGIYEYTDLGEWSWNGGHKSKSKTETVPMFGAGVGLEWSWRDFLGHDFPNLYSTVEFGYSHMSFDYYNFGGFLYGGGIYYKF